MADTKQGFIVCEICRTNIFKLKWIDNKSKIGLYRICSQCSNTQCILSGYFNTGELDSSEATDILTTKKVSE